MKKIFRGRRIIPCLDIKDDRIVKGVKFQNLRNFGDPFEMALLYEKQGADEIALLNVQGEAGKADMENLLKKLSKELSASIIAGGGVYSIQDVKNYLSAGADRVSISSAAIKNPDLVKEAVSLFGQEKIIVAIDAKIKDDEDEVSLINFAKTIEDMGAGEILLTSISADGVKAGYDIAMLNRVCKAVNIPVIASGGCGKLEHFIEVFKETKCGAALAASVFHEGELRVDEVKKALLDIHFEKSEFIPAIVQDVENDQVLMLAYMNLESLEKTLESGFTWFYSRSRSELWNKGATSGNYQRVVSITPDCDNDALLVKVVQNGPACHMGEKSCFYRTGGLYSDGKILSRYID